MLEKTILRWITTFSPSFTSLAWLCAGVYDVTSVYEVHFYIKLVAGL